MSHSSGHNRGFTLIELMVVITIIAVISSIIFVVLNDARGKGNDTKVKAQLSAIRAKAELFYDSNASYNGSAGNISGSCITANSMFTDVASGMSIQTLQSNYPSGATVTCYSTVSTYAVSALLPGQGDTNSWCVDSTGASKSRITPINSTAC